MYETFYKTHLQNATNRNGEVIGLCPFHDDQKPSFNANVKTGQAYCFGCGWKGNAITFAQECHIPFHEVPEYQTTEKVKIADKKIVATYNYVDEKGQLLYQVVRYEPKDFRFRRPDGNHDWTWNLNGIRRVLYRLPQILNAEEVIIVEGEKDTDILIDAGFSATTCAGGAGNWKKEYNEYLKDKSIILIPDKDPAGIKHAHQIASSLNKIVKCIKIVELPDSVGTKGDVYDFLKKHTPDDMQKLIDVAAPLSKSAFGKNNDLSNEIEFPDVYNGVAGEFADLYSSYLEPPKQFFYMAFLTCLGSILSDKLTLQGELKEQPRFYVLLLGESADVRKSTAIDRTISFFKDSVFSLSEELNLCRGLGSAEGLQYRLNDPKSIKESKKLLLCFDEFKAFLNKCTIRSSVLLQCVNSLFHLNEYENHTKTTNLHFEHVYISILAASTINTYKNAWSPQFTDIGFNNRLFIVPGQGKRKYAIPREIPENKKNELKIKLGSIFQLIGDHGLELNITPDAKTLYDEWYHSVDMSSIHSKRLDTYALRLMPLLAINEEKDVIDLDIVHKVIEICNWQFQMRLQYDPIDADNEITKMEERIRRQLQVKGTLSNRDLKKALHMERKQHGAWTFKMAIKNLSEIEDIVKNNQGKWELNDES